MSIQRRRDWPDEFRPNRTPAQMLRLGVFGGAYFADEQLATIDEFPVSWYRHLSPRRYLSDPPDPTVNLYGVLAGQSQAFWEEKGWMHPDDPRGWFQWYCRYYRGRRHEDDARQLDRWVRFAGVGTGRWTGNLFSQLAQSGASVNDASISPVIRQSLLQWAYVPTQADYRYWTKLREVTA